MYYIIKTDSTKITWICQKWTIDQWINQVRHARGICRINILPVK